MPKMPQNSKLRLAKRRAEAGDHLTGWRRDNALTYAALDPLIGSWLTAAPVLALLQPNLFTLTILKKMARERASLNQVLVAAGIPTVFRRMPAEAAAACNAHFYTAMAVLTNEDFSGVPHAQGDIPDWRQVVANINWSLSNPWSLMTRPADGLSAWAMKHDIVRLDEGHQAEIWDYFHNVGFRFDWSPNRILKEHKRWVEATARLEREAEMAKPENQVAIDLDGAPERFVHDGGPGVGEVVCRALTRPADLIEEGGEMHHCVFGAGFRQELLAGRARFYALSSKNGRSTVMYRNGFGSHAAEAFERAATLADPFALTPSLDRQVHIAEHKGPYNDLPPAGHQLAAAELRPLVVVPKADDALFDDPLVEAGRAQRLRDLLGNQAGAPPGADQNIWDLTPRNGAVFSATPYQWVDPARIPPRNRR